MKKQPIKQPYMTEKWFKTLKEQIASKSMSVVAAELNYSKTTLSLIVNGKYAGKTTERVREKVLMTYDVVACPYQNQMIAMSECVALATMSAPTHNPIKMQQWRACQNCPKRPKERTK